MSDRQATPRGGDQRRPDAGERRPDTAGKPPAATGSPSFLTDADLEAVTRRWHETQAAFVDTPRQAVQNADALVADLLKRMAETFAAEHHKLTSSWSGNEQISTEDLRVSLQRYRSFFQRLLAVR